MRAGGPRRPETGDKERSEAPKDPPPVCRPLKPSHTPRAEPLGLTLIITLMHCASTADARRAVQVGVDRATAPTPPRATLSDLRCSDVALSAVASAIGPRDGALSPSHSPSPSSRPTQSQRERRKRASPPRSKGMSRNETPLTSLRDSWQGLSGCLQTGCGQTCYSHHQVG